MLLFVLIDKALEVLMHRVEESVHFFQASLCQGLDLADTLVNHSCKLLALVRIFLRGQIKLVEEDFADLDNLFVAQLEIFVCDRHAEVTVHEVSQAVHVLIVDNCR